MTRANPTPTSVLDAIQDVVIAIRRERLKHGEKLMTDALRLQHPDHIDALLYVESADFEEWSFKYDEARNTYMINVSGDIGVASAWGWDPTYVE